MAGLSTDYLLLRQRKRQARIAIHEGLNLKEFAEQLDVTPAAVSRYLLKRAPDLHAALKNNSRGSSLHPETTLNRLRTLHSSRTLTEAAKRLNMTPGGLCSFIKRNAPDGVEDALADYEATYGAPLFDQRTAA